MEPRPTNRDFKRYCQRIQSQQKTGENSGRSVYGGQQSQGMSQQPKEQEVLKMSKILNSYVVQNIMFLRGFPGGSVVRNPPSAAGDARDMGSDPWVRKLP